MNYAQEYPRIEVVIDGVTYTLKIDTSQPAPDDAVGAFIYDATAYNSDSTASVDCAIYEPTTDSETYYISYLGENVYYPALVQD